MPGKTIVLTGASDGIGAAGARRLIKDGHDVVLVGRSAEKTAALAHELHADHFVADFSRLAEVTARRVMVTGSGLVSQCALGPSA